MLNPETGMDDAKYLALLLAAAQHARPATRAEVLERLIAAVRTQAERRARCRDTDLRAATRLRGW